MEDLHFREEQLDEIRRCMKWLMHKDTWEDHKQEFRAEIMRLDRIRNEDFSKTFPEIQYLYKIDNALKP